MLIRRAVPSDAAALADLGARSFVDAFGALNRADDTAMYVAKTYGEPQQRREIEDPNGVTLLAVDDDEMIAFSQLRRGSSPHGDVELARFYVDRGHHGRGIAHSLMDATLAAARTLGGTKLWLSVWERNPRAIRFYEKRGFTDAGTQPFLVGTDLQTDRVMVLVIPAV